MINSAITGPLEACVHCGFCLPACPTYEVTADEADSPRGRIVLMRALARGEISAADAGLGYHLDRCLGCRACEPVCPSGVAYGHGLEAARAEITAARGQQFLVRAMLWVLALPSRQRLLWALARLLRLTGLPRALSRHAGAKAPAWVRQLAMLAATDARSVGPSVIGPSLPLSHCPTVPPSHCPTVPLSHCVLFRGCIMDGLFSHVHDATITALGANNVATGEVPGQVCCGALAAHAGDADLARDLARRNIAAFELQPDDVIVVNSAGCGAMLRDYGNLLADDPAWAGRARALGARVRDVSEVLAERGPRRGERAVPLRVAYDAACHLVHAQRVSTPPLAVLAAIPGLELVPLEGSDRCCGAAGLYAMLEPELSQEVLDLKLDALARSGAEVIVTGNPGCLMHIGAGALLRGQHLAVMHPVELLARSYR